MTDQKDALSHLSKRVISRIGIQYPKHVVIIPDGNRRWTRERNKPTFFGHKKGFDRAIDLVEYARKLEIKYLTIWGFSTENWNRSEGEVGYLMKIFERMLKKIECKLIRNQISFHHFGRKDRLPKNLLKLIAKLENEMKKFTDYHFALCLDYGGRDELTRAFNKIDKNKPTKEIEINEALDSKDFPDVDFIIRTSGEQRLSGMMPWQSVYAELYFSPKYFPDFDRKQFLEALGEYSLRQRRLGR